MNHHLAVWSSGMILALGVRSSGFNFQECETYALPTAIATVDRFLDEGHIKYNLWRRTGMS